MPDNRQQWVIFSTEVRHLVTQRKDSSWEMCILVVGEILEEHSTATSKFSTLGGSRIIRIVPQPV
ncbi:hypothetical protein CY34DRAFT_813037 [Suillus luteus UH-Slu-Lm8-n1]|uniref:Uncharacterized protein n=1 Tax=Suillus luteus UH-Slu-Lm8-n1 TaxID=930992 RepID=A0A0C9ZXQ1_9AGAM|nr:hypothetical protein CY34DRAFT_813037 [Suillus luteus UH-Slu-Lm8-n1]